MSARAQSSAILYCHPDTPCAAIQKIESSISCERSNILTVSYILKGAVDQLRVPLDGPVRRAYDLWQHTCFEFFIGAKNDVEYYEFNFSPSGEWAAYEFRNYRDGGPIDVEGLEPKIIVQRGAGTLELSAVLRLDRLAGLQTDVCLAFGLSAVIENLDGSLSYWALKHPPGKPDFHHSDAFALEIAFAG